MRERLQPTLTLLDQGLSLYRRNFTPLALLALAWLAPFAVAGGWLISVGDWLSEDALLLVILGVLLLSLPLTVYLIAALSRAAGAALDGRAVRAREALAVPPLRLAGMGCFSLVYLFIAQIAASALSMVLICPLYLVGILLFGGMMSLTNLGEGVSIALGVLFMLVFAAVYTVGLVIGGATYSSLIYGLQPWVQERAGFGATLSRCVDLLIYRFWRNLLAWGLAAVLVAAAGLTVTIAIGVILPLPLSMTLGAESNVTQAVTLVAWLFGLALVLPPLPIWMTMLYRRNLVEREGGDLDERVRSWRVAHLGEERA